MITTVSGTSVVPLLSDMKYETIKQPLRHVKHAANKVPFLRLDMTVFIFRCLFNSPHSWWSHPCHRASAPWEGGSWSPECRSVSAVPGGRWPCSRPSGGRLRSTAWRRWMEVMMCHFKAPVITIFGTDMHCCTHSTVNSWAPTGMQYTNCMALQRRWNSTHSSTCITPLLGSGPRQMVSSRKPRTRVRMTSNMDKPQHSLSLVKRSPSRAMAICC